MSSVQDTQKITNAMYLIASTKLRKTKLELEATKPYFDELGREMKRICRTVDDVESPYFYGIGGEPEPELEGCYGYLVITADKGLAGAYNQNVLRETQRLLDMHDENRVFVVGEYGRQYFRTHGLPMEEDFDHTAQNPTLHRAREISSRLLDMYLAGELKKIFVIYTDYGNGMVMEAKSTRLLPFHRSDFESGKQEKPVKEPFTFFPDVDTVLDSIVPSYIMGFVYGALVESFCSEQNARMTAMDSANDNAQKLLDELSVQYNHVRQSAITQEITEVSASARAQRQRKQKMKEARS